MMSAPFKVIIAGDVVYESSTRIKLLNGTVVASGTKVLTHNTDGSKSFTASVTAAIYYYDNNVSGTDTWELNSIPRKATISSAPSFDDTSSPTVTYSNPAGSAVTKLEIGIFDSNGSQSLAPYRTISTSRTSYTFNFTEAERTNLYNYATQSAVTVKFYIRTTIGSNTYLDSVAKTLTIVDANPIVSVVIDDSEQDTYEIAGAGVITRHRSLLYVSCYADAQKGATLKSCSITNSGQTTNYWEETFMNPTDSVVTCRVEDSRGNVTTKEIDLANNNLGYSWVNYIVPTCSASASASLKAGSQT